MPPRTPFMACTATATHAIQLEIMTSLEMNNCITIFHSPDRPNVLYEVKARTTIDYDFSGLVHSLREKVIESPRVLVYCQSLNMCSDLYAHFLYELGSASYYPPDSPQISDNRLFGMFHSCTPQHNKDVITQSLLDPNGLYLQLLLWEWGWTFRE